MDLVSIAVVRPCSGLEKQQRSTLRPAKDGDAKAVQVLMAAPNHAVVLTIPGVEQPCGIAAIPRLGVCDCFGVHFGIRDPRVGTKCERPNRARMKAPPPSPAT